MPKIRTHKATAKRIKRRGKKGSVKRRNAYATHLLGTKSTKRKRGFRKIESVSSADMDRVKRALVLQ